MTRVVYKRHKSGRINPEPVLIEVFKTPEDQPFNPDGFINLIAKAMIEDIKAGKFPFSEA